MSTQHTPARSSGEQWYRDNDYNWMTDDQWECFEMLCDLCKGAHHIGGKVKPWGKGIAVNLRYGFHAATYDFNGLTDAVFLAHDRCIRFEIEPSGPGMLRLVFHKRHLREGDMCLRHPTLDQAIVRHRERFADKATDEAIAKAREGQKCQAYNRRINRREPSG